MIKLSTFPQNPPPITIFQMYIKTSFGDPSWFLKTVKEVVNTHLPQMQLNSLQFKPATAGTNHNIWLVQLHGSLEKTMGTSQENVSSPTLVQTYHYHLQRHNFPPSPNSGSIPHQGPIICPLIWQSQIGYTITEKF